MDEYIVMVQNKNNRYTVKGVPELKVKAIRVQIEITIYISSPSSSHWLDE